jgi:N-acetyl-anhydromuramyl-L-alanine amidase AmpD
MPDIPGAHCKQAGMNRNSIGVCFVGNFDEVPPPPEAWEAGLKVVAYFCKRYGIPIENIIAHRDYATYKTCPGKLFDMAKFKMDLEPLLPE